MPLTLWLRGRHRRLSPKRRSELAGGAWLVVWWCMHHGWMGGRGCMQVRTHDDAARRTKDRSLDDRKQEGSHSASETRARNRQEQRQSRRSRSKASILFPILALPRIASWVEPLGIYFRAHILLCRSLHVEENESQEKLDLSSSHRIPVTIIYIKTAPNNVVILTLSRYHHLVLG